jgi:hypothetical protein
MHVGIMACLCTIVLNPTRCSLMTFGKSGKKPHMNFKNSSLPWARWLGCKLWLVSMTRIDSLTSADPA